MGLWDHAKEFLGPWNFHRHQHPSPLPCLLAGWYFIWQNIFIPLGRFEQSSCVFAHSVNKTNKRPQIKSDWSAETLVSRFSRGVWTPVLLHLIRYYYRPFMDLKGQKFSCADTLLTQTTTFIEIIFYHMPSPASAPFLIQRFRPPVPQATRTSTAPKKSWPPRSSNPWTLDVPSLAGMSLRRRTGDLLQGLGVMFLFPDLFHITFKWWFPEIGEPPNHPF